MRKINAMRCILAFILVIEALAGWSQAPYFQQEVDYRIEVRLDDSLHRLEGQIAIQYTNRSPDTLTEIWMHLWPNAFAGRNTAFCRQKLRQRDAAFYFADEKKRGRIENLDFRTDNIPLVWRADARHPDIARLTLRQPLAPGESVVIETPFSVQIPSSFSRLGHVEQSYQITQWYPKPAVYDRKGWHPMPYLDQGEFYSEFGHFDVRITLPANYVVGATGTLLTASEREFLRQKERETRELLRNARPNDPKDPFPPTSHEWKTLHFSADSVHDFAWFADKRFLALTDTARLNDGREILCTALFTRKQADLWRQGAFYVKRAITFYSQHVGPYPWPQATAVHSALSAGAGMEYPMITVIGNSSDAASLDEVITHEVGHNWFYGILASNERLHAWLDEGLNTYYEFRYMDAYYPNRAFNYGLPAALYSEKKFGKLVRMAAMTIARERRPPPDTHAERFGEATYGIQSYMKPAFCLAWLEKSVGTARFDAAMQHYFSQWRMRHPYPEDLQEAWQAAGLDANWFFDAMRTQRYADYTLRKVRRNADQSWTLTLKNRGELPAPIHLSALRNGQVKAEQWYEAPANVRSFDVVFPDVEADAFALDVRGDMLDMYPSGNFRRTGGILPGIPPLRIGIPAFLPHLNKSNLGLLPWLGWNNFDKTMLGLAIYNPPFPTPRFQYILAPGIGLGSGALAGLADVRYNLYPSQNVQRLTLGLQAKQFAFDHANDAASLRQFTRITPFAQADWRMASSSMRQRTAYRALYINRRPSAPSSEGPALGQWIHELSHSLSDDGLPHPYTLRIALEGQQYRDLLDREQAYLRLSAEWRQKFYYAEKKKITARAFGGYFPYNTRRRAGAVSNDLARGSFALNPQGFNDYRFDQVFLDRSTSDRNLLARQVSQTEGGFKQAFGPEYAMLMGNSNHFILALNLKADLPLPLPIKPWFDLGYYADATPLGEGRPLNEQWLWSGGVMLDLLDGAIEVYFPIINAPYLRKLYRDYSDGNYGRWITWSFRLNRTHPADALDHTLR